MRLLLSAILAAVGYVGALPTCSAPQQNGTSSSPSNASPNTPSNFVASTWFAGWHAEDFSVSKLSLNKYTHIKYAFATTTSDVNTLGFTQEDATTISELVNAAHKNGVKVSISVGGWTGSRFFSSAVADAQNRTKFVTTLSNFVTKFLLDGIDFDWEYPNGVGVGCNLVSPEDTANFLLLLQQLRSTPSTSKLILTAATSIKPFLDSSGTPSTDVKGFAAALDYVEIMNYDIWGSWSTSVGPNAPLDDSCASAALQQGSATSAVAAWSHAGMPNNKIVLGVGSYGHSFSVTIANALQGSKLVAYPLFDKENQPNGDKWSGAPGPDACGVQQLAGGTYDFWGLVTGGFLDTTGQPAQGIDYRFDNCSKTAYVYNSATLVEVSYDDVPAFEAKGEYIKSAGLRGFSMWEAGGDYQDFLLDAIRRGAKQA